MIKILRDIPLLKPYVIYIFMSFIIFKILMNVKAPKRDSKKEKKLIQIITFIITSLAFMVIY